MSQADFPQAFSPDFDVVALLGEGAYGEVKLLKHRSLAEHPMLAVKQIYCEGRPEIERMARKESQLMRHAGRHPHVIEFLQSRLEAGSFFLFLEYADGGELFDRIEPDEGLPSWLAQRWFRQLVGGLEFLHGRGLAHRDLKPENCLLAGPSDVLKIADFGLATLFRKAVGEPTRRSTSKCGTLQYAAPEVLHGFEMEPLDVWSTGIILVAMLSGELPWDRALPVSQSTVPLPSYRDPFQVNAAFSAWKEKVSLEQAPWSKLDNLAISLLRLILQPSPDVRASIPRIKAHPWFSKDFARSTEPGLQRCVFEDCGPPTTSNSQRSASPQELEEPAAKRRRPDETPSFSQPVDLACLLVTTQSSQVSQLTQAMSPFERVVRRMTRFCVSIPPSEAVNRLAELCERRRFEVTRHGLFELTAKGPVRQRYETPLSFRLSAIQMRGKVLLDFRLIQGDGLELKRVFRSLRGEAIAFVCPNSDVWLSANGLVARVPTMDGKENIEMKGSESL